MTYRELVGCLTAGRGAFGVSSGTKIRSGSRGWSPRGGAPHDSDQQNRRNLSTLWGQLCLRHCPVRVVVDNALTFHVKRSMSPTDGVHLSGHWVSRSVQHTIRLACSRWALTPCLKHMFPDRSRERVRRGPPQTLWDGADRQQEWMMPFHVKRLSNRCSGRCLVSDDAYDVWSKEGWSSSNRHQGVIRVARILVTFHVKRSERCGGLL